jgi:MraZ protein
MDSAGRILITPELRGAAQLAKEVMLLGMGSHFEIWDAAALQVKEQEAIAAGMPDALSGFAL